MLPLLLLSAAFMPAYFNFIDLQLLIVACALQNIRWRVIAMAFYMRRRRRIRRRLWRLPRARPVNSWFEVHYCDPTLSDDYFKQLTASCEKTNLPSTLKHPSPMLLSCWADCKIVRVCKMHEYCQKKKDVSNDGFDRSFCFMAL